MMEGTQAVAVFLTKFSHKYLQDSSVRVLGSQLDYRSNRKLSKNDNNLNHKKIKDTMLKHLIILLKPRKAGNVLHKII